MAELVEVQSDCSPKGEKRGNERKKEGKSVYLQGAKQPSVAVAIVYDEDIAVSESGIDLGRD